MCQLGSVVKKTTDTKVIAWRSWDQAIGWLISPVYNSVDWKTENTVFGSITCKNHRGFHAFKNRKDATEYELAGVIVGKVQLSGTVIHHWFGFRAEKLKILSLSDRKLAKRYKVAYCGKKPKRKQ